MDTVQNMGLGKLIAHMSYYNEGYMFSQLMIGRMPVIVTTAGTDTLGNLNLPKGYTFSDCGAFGLCITNRPYAADGLGEMYAVYFATPMPRIKK